MANVTKDAIQADWFQRGKFAMPGDWPTTADDMESAFRTMHAIAFENGARWGLQETAKLSPYISRFLEMCILLGPR